MSAEAASGGGLEAVHAAPADVLVEIRARLGLVSEQLGLQFADGRGVVGGAQERAAEHGEPHDDADQADEHQAPPPGPVHEEHAHDRADGVQARSDEGKRHGRVVGREAGQLHDRRAVVHDGVDSHELLRDLDDDAGHQPPPDDLAAQRLPQLANQALLADGTLKLHLFFDRLAHGVNLLLHLIRRVNLPQD